jgi:two-component system chemotaxis sensor kinase CheA
MLEDKEILREFVVESRERLADVENRLLAIEAAGSAADAEMVNEVFRAVHSIKGAAGFLGLQKLGQLAHHLENVLNLVRNHQLVPDGGVTNTMLRSADLLRKMLDDVEQSDTVDISEQVDRLEQIIAGLLAEESGHAQAGENQDRATSPVAQVAKGPLAADVGSACNAFLDIARDRLESGPTSPAQPAASRTTTPPASAPTADSNIRVSVTVLDRLMNLAGELVLARNQLLQNVGTGDRSLLDSVAARVNQVTSELQETIMQTRLQMVGTVFNKFPRVVRDLSQALGKQCQLIVEGQEVELDKSIIEAIGDPLTHLIRNSIDHGVESPQVRVLAGKPAEGTITLRAFHRSGKVHISIRDDGAGIDVARIRDKAVNRGIISADQARAMSDREALQLIFQPGFSLAEKVTQVSGRGVGMDVVKTNIERLGGTVNLETKVGSGTHITVKLPLTLAIVPALTVCSKGRRYAIPQTNISELVRVKAGEITKRIQRIKGAEVLRLRGDLLPLVRLDTVLGLSSDRSAASTSSARNGLEIRDGEDSLRAAGRDVRNIIVVETAHLRYGLIVERLSDSEEIVVKPLGRHLKDCLCLAGATILGDGTVALILDVAAIATHCHLLIPDQEDGSKKASAGGTTLQEKPTVLVFRNHPDEQFAVPMQLIVRLERIRAEEVQCVGGQKVLKYRDRSLPLLSLEDHIRACSGPEFKSAYVVVFNFAQREVGLLVHEVVDIREVDAQFDAVLFRQPGVMGSVIMAGRVTRLLDVFELTETAHPEWVECAGKAAPVDGPRHTILLAEDSDFFRKQLATFLERAGHRVIACVDGLAAWNVLRQPPCPIDLVVTDVEMPNLNGFELARRIRGDAELARLPIIAVTSLASDEDRARGLEAGIEQYHVKLDREQLIATVDQILATLDGSFTSPGAAKAFSS